VENLISIIYIKMNRYSPWSRHHACTDGPILLFLFLKCSLKSKGEAHGEKNSKNCLENSEKKAGRSCSVDKIIDNYSALLLITDDNSARWG
jgi:hypothetical protein